MKAGMIGAFISALIIGPIFLARHKNESRIDRLPEVKVTQLSNGAAIHRTIDKDLNRVCYVVFTTDDKLPQQVAITCEDI